MGKQFAQFSTCIIPWSERGAVLVFTDAVNIRGCVVQAASFDANPGVRFALIVVPSMVPELAATAALARVRVNIFPDCEMVKDALGPANNFAQGFAATWSTLALIFHTPETEIGAESECPIRRTLASPQIGKATRST